MMKKISILAFVTVLLVGCAASNTANKQRTANQKQESLQKPVEWSKRDFIKHTTVEKKQIQKKNGNLIVKDNTFTSKVTIQPDEVKKLPDNLVKVPELKIQGTNFKFKNLPPRLHVRTLIISDYTGKPLPTNLNVKTLRLKEASTLPDNTQTINYSLNVEYSKIQQLPQNLTVRGDLNLAWSKNLKTLPEDLRVEGDLSLENSAVQQLPKGLHVGGNLDITDTNITSLPGDLTVKSCLFVANNLQEEAQQLQQKGNVGGPINPPIETLQEQCYPNVGR